MRVPAPARTAEGGDAGFEATLHREASAAETPTAVREPERAAADDEATDAGETAAGASPGTGTAEPVAPEALPRHASPTATDPGDAPAESADRNSTRNVGTLARRIETGKGAGVPTSTSPGTGAGAPGAAGAAPSPALVPAPHAAAATSPAPAAATIAASGTAPNGRLAGALAKETPAATLRETGTSGYRIWNPRTLQLAEQSRDSLFRQIVMRLGSEGGEVRMLLDPPELGRLDLTMQVEPSGNVRLSILAERPELAGLLEKHMPELRAALTAQGLGVTHAEVRSHDRARREGPWPEPGIGGADHDEPEVAQAGHLHAGYVTADGLDFWV